MGGYDLVRTAFKSVFDNLNGALAVSGLLWIAVIALQLILAPSGMADVTGEDFAAAPNVGGLLIVSLVTIFVSLWVAVAWHRYMLLDEVPTQIIPKLNGARIGAYLMVSFFVGLVVGTAFIVVFALTSPIIVAASMAGAEQVVMFGLVTVFSYVFYRFGPVFPAAAIGEVETLRSAWIRTKPLGSALWGAAIIFSLLGTVLQAPALLLGSGVVGVVYSLVSGWVLLMVGVSLLTTIHQETEKVIG